MNAPTRSRKLRRKAIAVLIAACYSSVQAAPVSPRWWRGRPVSTSRARPTPSPTRPTPSSTGRVFHRADELTRFIQQSADSKVLNRITGQDPSVILGSLQSNGKVFLINPNGVLFGAGSRVDVNGLVASSLNISNADFLAGKNNFNGAANAGKVSNQGTITTPSGGQIFLIAPAVENSGIISAPNGEVVLAAGHGAAVRLGDPNVQVVVSSPSDQALNLGRWWRRAGASACMARWSTSAGHQRQQRGARRQWQDRAQGQRHHAGGSGQPDQRHRQQPQHRRRYPAAGREGGLSGNAVVDASGAAGGGTVLVGGDYQGKNAAVMNAQQAYVGKDALIRADALERGNGGKVVVWSDAATQVFGAISARGGAAGGNGGMVETSGHYLDMQGTVDTRAAWRQRFAAARPERRLHRARCLYRARRRHGDRRHHPAQRRRVPRNHGGQGFAAADQRAANCAADQRRHRQHRQQQRHRHRCDQRTQPVAVGHLAQPEPERRQRYPDQVLHHRHQRRAQPDGRRRHRPDHQSDRRHGGVRPERDRSRFHHAR
jgi:filamentous hemagglutinin family protein